MLALARGFHVAVILCGALLLFPPGLRIVPYALAAFLPPVAAWCREELGRRGRGGDGPSRTQTYALATIESLSGAACATIGLWVLPLFGIGASALVICWAVDWMGLHPRWDLEFEEEGLCLRQGPRRVEFTWRTLHVRRRGSSFVFQAGEDRLRVRFGSARAEEIVDEARKHGSVVVDEQEMDLASWPPFLVAAICTLLAAAYLRS